MNTTMLIVKSKSNGDVVARIYIEIECFACFELTSSDPAIEDKIETDVAYELIHRYGSKMAMEIDETGERIVHMESPTREAAKLSDEEIRGASTSPAWSSST